MSGKCGRTLKRKIIHKTMKERDIQAIFSRKNKHTGVFELKLCKGTSLPFGAVADHQIRALLAVEGEGLSYKISDMSMDKKPFDCFRLQGIPSYIVIVFYKPRKPKTFYYVRIHHFVWLIQEAGRKSATEEMIKNGAEKVEIY